MKKCKAFSMIFYIFVIKGDGAELHSEKCEELVWL